MDREPRIIEEAPEYSIYRDGTIVRTIGRNRTRAGKIMKPWSKEGYPAVDLRHEGRKLKRLVHRIVCATYHGPQPSPRHEVAHADGDPSNCHAENLRWATHRENEADKVRHKTKIPRTHCKLTTEQVRTIRRAPRKWGICKELAERYGVAHQTISHIRTDPSYWPEAH